MTLTTTDATLCLRPEGNLLASRAKELTATFLAELEGCEATTVELDLSEVGEVDSIGVNIVVGLFRECESRGLEYVVTVGDPHVHSLFTLFKLDQWFTVQAAEHA
ncbi:MAG: STAS domain-containing protein [Acidobacteriota bacterium]